MKYPYLLSSDQHCHSWSQFAHVDTDGVNSRLRIILNELTRSYKALGAAGGDTAFLAGDLFHVRGEIKPSVYNPTVETFTFIHDLGVEDMMTYAIPGNHDLEGKEASSLGNAMQGLGNIDGFNVCVEPKRFGDVWVFPWHQDLDKLRAALKKHANPKYDAIIHAPVNGVIKGIPDHGLEAAELAAFGYRRVFAGHFHDHKVFEDGKVVSIGATTHQTWSDPGTTAGFLLVYEDRIEHHTSEAPSFVELNAATLNPDYLKDDVYGNYAKIKLIDVTEKEIKQWRDDLTTAGAIGVNVIATKKTTSGRSGASAKAALSLASSVEHFVRNDLKPFLMEEVSALAQEILMEAQS